METGARAAREQIAGDRMAAAAVSLGERFGLVDQAEALVNAGHREPQVAALFRSEAVANLLEALDRATGEDGAIESPPALLAGTVDDVRAQLEDIDDQPYLEAQLREEKAGKDRTGVTEAIQARLQQLGEEQAAREAEEAAAPPPDVSVLDGTVVDVEAFLLDVDSADHLDALAGAERAGKNRVGIMQAIADRRTALKDGAEPS